MAGPGVAGGPIVVTGVMGVVGGVVSPATGRGKKRESWCEHYLSETNFEQLYSILVWLSLFLM